MFKRLRAMRRRLHERREYETLVSHLEHLNATDVGRMDAAPASRRMHQVYGGDRR